MLTFYIICPKWITYLASSSISTIRKKKEASNKSSFLNQKIKTQCSTYFATSAALVTPSVTTDDTHNINWFFWNLRSLLTCVVSIMNKAVLVKNCVPVVWWVAENALGNIRGKDKNSFVYSFPCFMVNVFELSFCEWGGQTNCHKWGHLQWRLLCSI